MGERVSKGREVSRVGQLKILEVGMLWTLDQTINIVTWMKRTDRSW